MQELKQKSGQNIRTKSAFTPNIIGHKSYQYIKEVCSGNKVQAALCRAQNFVKHGISSHNNMPHFSSNISFNSQHNLFLCQKNSFVTSTIPLQPYVIDCDPPNQFVEGSSKTFALQISHSPLDYFIPNNRNISYQAKPYNMLSNSLGKEALKIQMFPTLYFVSTECTITISRETPLHQSIFLQSTYFSK